MAPCGLWQFVYFSMPLLFFQHSEQPWNLATPSLNNVSKCQRLPEARSTLGSRASASSVLAMLFGSTVVTVNIWGGDRAISPVIELGAQGLLPPLLCTSPMGVKQCLCQADWCRLKSTWSRTMTCGPPTVTHRERMQFIIIFYSGTWEFNRKIHFYVHYVIKHRHLSATSQFDGNITSRKIILEYSHENLLPIGW